MKSRMTSTLFISVLLYCFLFSNSLIIKSLLFHSHQLHDSSSSSSDSRSGSMNSLTLSFKVFNHNNIKLYMANEGKGKKREGGVEKRQFASNRGRSTTATAGNPIRVARIARALRDELSSIICEGDIKAMVYPDFDLLRSTTVCEVEVSSDLSTATVFVSVLGNSVEKRQVFVWLCENVGQVRYELAQRLKHMKKVPDIFFKLADNQAAADLVSLIEEIAPKNVRIEDNIDFEEEDEEEE